MLSKEQIVSYIKNPRNKKLIDIARENEKQHNIHISGIGIDEKITKIQGLETDDAVSLRQSLQQPATKTVMANVLKPFDKVFSARGGILSFKSDNDTTNETMKKILNNVWNGRSLKDWMREVWKQRVNIDSFGLAFIENSRNVITNKLSTRITYKSIQYIRDIGYKTFTNIQYVIFEPEKIRINNRDFNAYRVIDTDRDLIILEPVGITNNINDYLIVGEDIEPIDSGMEIYENEFYVLDDDGVPEKRVPACFLSTNISNYDLNLTETYVANALIPADSYLIDHVINRIYKLRNGIPYIYEYERDCPNCDGTGEVDGGECPVCNGTGKAKNRNVSDVIILPFPEEAGDPMPVPPAGYVQPDLATWAKQEETLDRLKKEMYNAVWGEGTTSESSKNTSGNTTAYEIAIRKEPLKDSLDVVSRNAEVVEQYLTDLIGWFHLPDTYEGCSLQYGRRYDVLTSSEIWGEYITARNSNADIELLNELISEYYYSLYKHNKDELTRKIKVLKTKPFFHYDNQKLISIKDTISEIDYLGNLYYSDFINETEINLISTSVLDIKKQLKEYIRSNHSNLITPENPNVDEVGSELTQEMLTAQAKLRGSVGAVQGILDIQLSVQNGTTDYEAAIATLELIFGYDREKAVRLLGKVTKNINTNTNDSISKQNSEGATGNLPTE